MRQFSGYGLKNALIAGIRRVISRRDEINRINVFPVADGDTGTNLAFTLSAVMCAVKPMRRAHAGLIMECVAREAIDGARGNSGAIIAQYLQGVSESLIGAKKISLENLAAATQFGSRSAYDAIAQPREGTILSVLTAFSAALHQQFERGERDLKKAFVQALQATRIALLRTPEQLSELRNAGVVDAGAAGFVDMLEGIERYIETGEQEELTDDSLDIPIVAMAGSAEVNLDAHRFCTECVVTAEDIDRVSLREALLAMPISSLVIAGTRERVRVHAHVDMPSELFELCARFGNVGGQKADDTHAQADAAHSKRELVAIVCDSGADIPAEILDRLKIYMVSARVNIAGHDYLDKVSLPPREFFASLRRGEIPRTSQPPQGDFRRAFEFLLSHHNALVYVGLSRALSGTLQAGESAAARIKNARAHCVDSKHASVAQALVTIDAAEAAMAGLSTNQILQRVEIMRKQTELFCLIRDITYGVRGGRAPKLAGPICKLLRAKPLARNKADGRLSLYGFIWGERSLMTRYANSIARKLQPNTRYKILVGHCDCVDDGKQLFEILRRRISNAEFMGLVELGTGVGAHAGPGSLAVAVQASHAMPTPEKTTE